MKDECILCGRITKVVRPDTSKAEYSVECSACGTYTYDHFFKKAYTSLDKEKRAMVSSYTRECFELGKELPKLSDPDHIEDKIEKYKNKTLEEKLNNLLLYLKKKSRYLGDSVSWGEKTDYPITYSPNPQEFIKIRDHAIKRNLLFWKSRGAGLELSGDGWEEAEKLEKESKMEIREKSLQFLKALFELTRGDENDIRDMWEIGKALGFPNSLINRIGQYLKGEGSIVFRTEQGEISIAHEGVKKVEEATIRKDEIELKKRVNEKSKADPKKVFVVHGRNEKARKALFDYLRSVGIQPIEWGKAKQMTDETSPYPQQVLDVAFSNAQAIIVLITGDDVARLRDEYAKQDDEEYEKRLTPQARPNVIFEAGLAFGRNPKRTILVSLKKEKIRPFSDVLGRLFVRLSNKTKSRIDLNSQLENAGCEIDIKGNTDWTQTGDFDGAVIEYNSNETIEEKELKKEEKTKLNEEHYCILTRIASDREVVTEEALFKNYQEVFSQKKRIDFNFILNDLKRLSSIRHTSSLGKNKYYAITDEGFHFLKERQI